jgi:hypothetical protein
VLIQINPPDKSNALQGQKQFCCFELQIVYAQTNREVRRDATKNSPHFEIARLLVRLDHVASFIVNARITASKFVLPSWSTGAARKKRSWPWRVNWPLICGVSAPAASAPQHWD